MVASAGGSVGTDSRVGVGSGVVGSGVAVGAVVGAAVGGCAGAEVGAGFWTGLWVLHAARSKTDNSPTFTNETRDFIGSSKWTRCGFLSCDQ